MRRSKSQNYLSRATGSYQYKPKPKKFVKKGFDYPFYPSFKIKKHKSGTEILRSEIVAARPRNQQMHIIKKRLKKQEILKRLKLMKDTGFSKNEKIVLALKDIKNIEEMKVAKSPNNVNSYVLKNSSRNGKKGKQIVFLKLSESKKVSKRKSRSRSKSRGRLNKRSKSAHSSRPRPITANGRTRTGESKISSKFGMGSLHDQDEVVRFGNKKYSKKNGLKVLKFEAKVQEKKKNSMMIKSKKKKGKNKKKTANEVMVNGLKYLPNSARDEEKNRNFINNKKQMKMISNGTAMNSNEADIVSPAVGNAMGSRRASETERVIRDQLNNGKKETKREIIQRMKKFSFGSQNDEFASYNKEDLRNDILMYEFFIEHTMERYGHTQLLNSFFEIAPLKVQKNLKKLKFKKKKFY